MIRRIAMLPRLEVRFENTLKNRVVDKVSTQTVEKRCESRNARREQNPTYLEYSVGFTQRSNPVRALGEVVQRPHQQDDLSGAVRLIQLSCITDARRGVPAIGMFAQSPFGKFDMERHRIDETDLVALVEQPQRINAPGTANVENPRGRRRQMAPDDLLRANPLQLALSRTEEPRRFVTGGIMLGRLRSQETAFDHVPISSDPLGRSLNETGS